MRSRALALSLLTACAVGVGACGDDEDSEPSGSAAAGPAATQEAPDAAAADQAAPAAGADAMSCPDVPVPGHLAENVMAAGLDCDATVPIANAAEGLGRAAYKSNGFACEPTDAADGKTNYSCTMGDAKLTFLYG